jgi:lipid-A-disaccharide synthase-like uncharacterized protein
LQSAFLPRLVHDALRHSVDISERQKKSLVPVGFWYFSILDGVTLLIYSIHRQDPAFIAGQLLDILIYLRKLYLIRNSSKPSFQFSPLRG